MRKRAYRRVPQVLFVCTVALLAGGVSVATPANQTIDLCATTGTVTLPGNLAVGVWGFVHKGAAADCSDVAGTATIPGPALSVDENDVVTLNVTNALPPGHTISIEAPGLTFDPGPTDAPVGSTVTRTFTAGAPGTYLYESAGGGERQTAMGLYGALTVRSATAGRAYDTASSAYDVEARLVLSAIDPAFNDDPDGFDMRSFLPTYWLINGKAYPDTDPIHATAGQKVLLRYLNAGHDNTTMVLLGMDERVIARDANVLANPFDAHAETIPAGATEDVVATVPAASSGLTHGFPLYNRQLHLGNGSPPGAAPGGMMTFIQSP
ncbi:multicopper oxidase domain-containing protein [Solirubrobacter soli]|uniref:multicopper oxidase domain-containing protein n=1 Tax=Solirubrobacter soli TaxID=363832 RepID=UPI000404EF18|nr:multicopper oxidase domain-containing protein [Solirubrobacter soli]